MKRFLLLLMSFIMVVTMNVGCGKQDNPGETTVAVVTTKTDTAQESTSEVKEVKEPYEITFVHPGEPAKDMDVVVNEFYARTKDDLNVTLNFVHAGWDDIGQKVSLMISAGEKIDSAFLAPWSAPSITAAAQNEQLLNLDMYMNNDQYPGLKAAFSEEYLSTNKFVGSDGQYHVYGLPFTHTYLTGQVIYYRKDLADKYGITINGAEDLTAFYDEILKNETGMIPFSFLGSQDMLVSDIDSLYNTATPKKHNFGGVDLPGFAEAIIKDDGTAYVSRTFIPSADPEYAKYLDDAEPTKTDPYVFFKVAREFYEKGYVSADILNEQDAESTFFAGRSASYFKGSDVYNTVATQLSTSIPSAELGYLIVNNNFKNDIKGQVEATFQAWNFACIPVTCENPDRVMEFYDWIFSAQANLDLFEYGVEGKHWTAVGNDTYTPMTNPDTGNAYDFGGYLMTWNPTMYRLSSEMPDDIVELNMKTSNQEYFYKDFTAGFSFDPTNVQTELALINEVASIKLAFGNGVFEDIEGEAAKVDERLKKAGWETYALEYEKQLNEFLKAHPYEGQ